MVRPKRSRQPMSQRLDKQRERQQAYREEQKKARKPSRDDVARMLLHWVFTENLKRPERKADLDHLLGTLQVLLQMQGFEDQAVNDRLNQLLNQYSAGWEFRRKTHLTEQPILDVNDLSVASWGALAVMDRDG